MGLLIILILLQKLICNADVNTFDFRHQGNRVSKIYLPSKENLKRTKIIFIHGGGLIWGSPETKRYDEFSRKLGQLGYETFSLDYDLLWNGGSEEKNQKYFEDAVRYLKANDNSEIIIFGVSSGAWVGLKGIKNLNQNLRLKKFIGISPLVSFKGNFVTEFLTSQYSLECQKEDLIDIPIHLIRGNKDIIIPEISLKEFCKGKNQNCKIETVEGGHEILESFSIKELERLIEMK
jgi:predicted esterase